MRHCLHGIVSRFEKMWYRGLRTCDAVVLDEDVDGSHEGGDLWDQNVQKNEPAEGCER